MRVINSHKRIINQPIEKVSELFKTLAANENQIWPSNNCPAMRFKQGLALGNRGGHGRIRYKVIAFDTVQNYFSEEKKETKYNLWVVLLRSFYKRKSVQIIHN